MGKSTLEVWENRLAKPFRKWLKVNAELDRMMQEVRPTKSDVPHPVEFKPNCEISEDKKTYFVTLGLPTAIDENTIETMTVGRVLHLKVPKLEANAPKQTAAL